MSKIENKWLKIPGVETNEVPTGTINGANLDFVITQEPVTGSLKVMLDGLLDMDFTFDVPSKTISMTDAPVIGQQIRAIYNV